MLAARDFEGFLFVADHWVPNDRISLDLGLRYSGQTLGSAANVAPRLGVAYSPGHDGKTVFRGGLGRFYGHTPLLAGNFSMNPARQVSFFDDQGNLLGSPVTYVNAYGDLNSQGALGGLANFPWHYALQLDLELGSGPGVASPRHAAAELHFQQRLRSVHRQPRHRSGHGPRNAADSPWRFRYNELESTVHIRLTGFSELNVSYVYSKARGDLNTLAQLFVPFEQPVIRPNAYSNLASDTPNRIVSWGRFKTHLWGIEAGPVADFHSGFPYSTVDMRQNYIGAPNIERFPLFFSLDMKLSKEFHLPLPFLKKHMMRGSLMIFNLSNHSNPRDVFNNISSPYFGHFVGNQHRFFDSALDVLY